MIEILKKLEPFKENKGVTLVEEFDEFDIIQFVIKGKILIGFDMQHQRKFCL